MSVLAVDPGTTESAFVHYDPKSRSILWKDKTGNQSVRDILASFNPYDDCRLVIEMVACYGQPVGAEVFETAVWIGRFEEAALQRGCFAAHPYRMVRNEVKKHLCHKIVGVNDSVIRQVLIDRFGPTKETAIGNKKKPGPLYGVSGDVWQALALAVTFADQLTTPPAARR
jgi:hypothetical protein